MSNPTVAQGTCLCKAVSLSASQLSKSVGACHCNMCRKWGGSALLVLEGKSDVHFEGEENISIYPSSDWAERGFCKHCGTHLFYRLKQQTEYYLPVGLFDNIDELVFENQIFIDEKPEYYTYANETKNMTGAEVFALYAPPQAT
jgi:hypothetical protein